MQEVDATFSPHLQEGGCQTAIKFAMAPGIAAPSAGDAATTYSLTLRLPSAGAGACGDLRGLCGGSACLTSLPDKGYDNCPSYIVDG